MERIDHVDILQICRGGLVGKVDRVFERDVPDGEGFKLGVARFHTVLVFVIQLRKAGRQLAGAGAGCGHNDERARGLDEIVLAVSLIGDDQIDVHRVALDGIVQIGMLAALFQHLAEGISCGLTLILGDDHRRHIQPHAAQLIHQAQQVHVIGDAQIRAELAVADIRGVDAADDFRLIAEFLQQADLGVGLEPRQHAGGVEVVKELSAEFKVELVAKLTDALTNRLRLFPDVQIIVKSDLVHVFSPSPSYVSHSFTKQGAPRGAP